MDRLERGLIVGGVFELMFQKNVFVPEPTATVN